MQGLLKNSFELISRDNEGRKIVIGLSVALCAFVLLAWLGLKQIFYAEIHPNPPAVLHQLAQKDRYGTEADLAEVFNYYQTVWRIDYERETKGKQGYIQNWLANSQTTELKKKTEFLGHWLHVPLSEWHEHLKHIQHDYAYLSNSLPTHSQEYWMMFIALHKVYDGAINCQGRLFLSKMDAWQGLYSNDYRQLQSSCGDSSTQTLFQFLAQYQASDLRQPGFIENAIMAIENSTQKQHLMQAYKSHLNNLAMDFHQSFGEAYLVKLNSLTTAPAFHNKVSDKVKQQYESQIAWLNYLMHSQS